MARITPRPQAATGALARASAGRAAAQIALLAIDAGGGAAGAFAADAGYTGSSNAASTSNAIDTSAVTNPAPQAVYQTERYGNFTYTAGGLAPGTAYLVRLHFAEFFWGSAGQRVFSVALNGNQVLTNFDIVKAAGAPNKAIVEPFTVAANASGQIVMTFTASVDYAKLSGFEILPAAVAAVPQYIRTGGGAVGNYTADPGPSSGTSATYVVGNAIDTSAVTNPAPQGVYQGERYGKTFAYTLGGLTAGGTYTVRLHFAEIYWSAIGQRVFNVAVNGTPALTNFDIVKSAGGAFKATAQSLPATADASGQIVLGFTTVTDNAKIAGIELQAGGATPSPTPSPVPTSPPPATQDNTTYHRDNGRTGWYASEVTLTASSVAANLHLIKTLATGGKSYSQPLYLSNESVGGVTHNLLLVTDSADVVYAYDADALNVVWQRDFKNAAAGIRQQLASDTGCDDTWPNVGINGTPVVDRGRDRMYVVVPTYESGAYHLRLHALALGSGNDAVPPVEITGSSSLASGGTAAVNPEYNFDRAGLLETGNAVYVPLSDHCDFNSDGSHGWLLAYNPDTLAQTGSLLDTTNKDIGTIAGVRFLGSIWQGGFGIAADAASNVYFATGNGPFDGTSDFSMSALRVPPTLDITKASYFTPRTWQGDSQGDADLGSGGVMLLPDQSSGSAPHLAITGGKTGMKYLLNRDNLGGFNATTDQVLYENNTGGGIWGGPAYYVDAAGNQTILYGGSPNLNAYTLSTAPYGLHQTSATNVGSLENRNGGVTPVVSSNGTKAGTAVVWTVMTPPGGTNGTGIVKLYAFDGANLGNTLFSANAGQWTGNGNTGGAMITPLVANGRVYLATDGQVTVFGTK